MNLWQPSNRQRVVALLTFSISVGIGILFYSSLPEEIAIHWSVSGSPDNYAPKLIGVFILPAIIAFLGSLSYFLQLDDIDEDIFSLSHLVLMTIQVLVVLYNIGYTSIPIVPVSLFLGGLLAIVSIFLGYMDTK